MFRSFEVEFESPILRMLSINSVKSTKANRNYSLVTRYV